MSEGFRIYRRNLPHWRFEGHVYFVTWRLASAQEFMSAKDRTLVFEAVLFFNRERFTLHAQVVMDDHVHVIVAPEPGHKLETIVHSWKSFSANKLRKSQGRQGNIWQREYFDRIIRNNKEYYEKFSYIINNPVIRWPWLEKYDWVWTMQ